MIYHIFKTNTSHLLYQITKNILLHHNVEDHYFIFIGKDDDKINGYISIYRSFVFTKYKFFESNVSLLKSGLIKPQDVILFHSASYSLMFLLMCGGYKHVNWICWGSGTVIYNTIISRMSALFKRILYKHLYSIVTLIEPDKQSLIDYFDVAPEKIHVISYYPSYTIRNDITAYRNSLKIEKNNKLVVYLGNSPHSLSEYIVALDDLIKFRGQIEIHCMLQYALDEESKLYTDLLHKGRNLWGNDIYYDKEYMSLEEYYRYMAKCDIYICGTTRQTGLGAIYNCIRMGKTIYLNGKNYDHICSLGIKVKHYDELNVVEQLDLVSKDVCQKNLYALNDYLDVDIVKNKWDRYYKLIDSDKE